MKKSIIAIICVLLSLSLFAGDTGIIKGTIVAARDGSPLIGANIFLKESKQGAATDLKGKYFIKDVSAGKYELVAQFIGYSTIVKNIEVKADSILTVDIEMEIEMVESQAITISAERPLIMQEMKISRVQSEAASFLAMSYPANRMQFPVSNTEEYSKIDETGFLEVTANPLSTFAADVDAASYANVRRFIMQGKYPYADAVRTEELVNYFSYDYEVPRSNDPLSINLEYSDCPWNDENQLIHIGLRGKSLQRDEEISSNLVFLLDVSGSMKKPDKLPLLKQAFKLLVKQLTQNDRVSIVVYAGAAGEVLSSTPGSEKKKILRAIDKLEAGGSTAGGAGIQMAYKIAKENFIKGGNNRVILATDGDFNVGISSSSELVRYIEDQRDNGIFLTVLGFGQGNYKDNRLQELADRGNGTHAYIDNIMEAKKVLVDELTGTLYTIAKDVKIQVEFNPAKVHSYRLLGYENRRLANEDYEDDKKDAGEVGAGHTVTALYEIVPLRPNDKTQVQELKYQETKIKNSAFKSSDVLTVRIRYKDPDGDQSQEISKVLTGKPIQLAKASNNFRFSAAVAQFAQILRDSEFKGEADLKTVKKLAKGAKGDDEYGYRAEFINLVERCMLIEKRNSLKDGD
ncbi:MAG: von Willebrand factor type A domain-containing protein [Candidatus Marinimicrobia bacterium]|nr:von Willebrand factor type A domain-containing protein [FCB group bacterium]MBL7024471.1 von Willebrand factor type A domain-containing protein [Candidatus Neomarinimicrobiota bacterium]